MLAWNDQQIQLNYRLLAVFYILDPAQTKALNHSPRPNGKSASNVRKNGWNSDDSDASILAGMPTSWKSDVPRNYGFHPACYWHYIDKCKKLPCYNRVYCQSLLTHKTAKINFINHVPGYNTQFWVGENNFCHFICKLLNSYATPHQHCYSRKIIWLKASYTNHKP